MRRQSGVRIAIRKGVGRVQVEGIAIDEESLAYLGEIGERSSLRHAVQLLTPAQTVAASNGRDSITYGDVKEVHTLFHDAKYTSQLLKEQAAFYVH